MKYLYPLLFVVLFLIIGTSWYNIVVGADPKEEGVAFLQSVQSGGLAKTVKHFGSNVCRCPHKGGWGAYLIYASGQEPNLAFMIGKPFELGKPTMFKIRNKAQALIPWQKPEDTVVDIPVTFDAKKYMPYFLPLAMAYGQKMSETDFQKFLADPDNDAWKGLTLRFRTGLTKGSIAPPAEPLPPDAKDEFKALQVDEKNHKQVETPADESTESTEDAIRHAIGAEGIAYVQPKEAGKVVDASGAVIDQNKIQAELPRVKEITMRLHVVRRGATSEWTIYHLGVLNPVLTTADGHELKLTHYLRPSAHAAEKAAKQLETQIGQPQKSEMEPPEPFPTELTQPAPSGSQQPASNAPQLAPNGLPQQVPDGLLQKATKEVQH